MFVTAIKDAEMHSMAFPDSGSFDGSDAQPVKIVLGSSCSTEVKPVDSEAKVVRDLHPYVFLVEAHGSLSLQS